MNISKFSVVALGFCFMFSCTNNGKASNETKEVTQVNILKDENAKQPEGFDLSKIAVTTENVGEFPYFPTPQSYKYLEAKTKEYEEKLFFYNDSMTCKVGGKYYHARILPNEKVEFEETYVVNNYQKMIEKLGGIEIYSGPLDKTYNKVMAEDLPYLKDLYDPYAYRYKQFVIRTAKENIWIELIHGLNANMMDLTVVKERSMK